MFSFVKCYHQYLWSVAILTDCAIRIAKWYNFTAIQSHSTRVRILKIFYVFDWSRYLNRKNKEDHWFVWWFELFQVVKLEKWKTKIAWLRLVSVKKSFEKPVDSLILWQAGASMIHETSDSSSTRVADLSRTPATPDLWIYLSSSNMKWLWLRDSDSPAMVARKGEACPKQISMVLKALRFYCASNHGLLPMSPYRLCIKVFSAFS